MYDGGAGELEQDDDGVEWEEVQDEAQAGTSCCNGPAVASKSGELLGIFMGIYSCGMPITVYLEGGKGPQGLCLPHVWS